MPTTGSWLLTTDYSLRRSDRGVYFAEQVFEEERFLENRASLLQQVCFLRADTLGIGGANDDGDVRGFGVEAHQFEHHPAGIRALHTDIEDDQNRPMLLDH